MTQLKYPQPHGTHLTRDQYNEIRSLIASGKRVCAVCKMFSIGHQRLKRIISDKTYQPGGNTFKNTIEQISASTEMKAKISGGDSEQRIYTLKQSNSPNNKREMNPLLAAAIRQGEEMGKEDYRIHKKK